MINLIFFGSFQHYSTLILQSLVNHSDVNVLGVITTPPRPAGKNQSLQKTHTHTWCESHHLPVGYPEKLDQTSLDHLINDWQLVIGDTSKKSVDFFVVAGYSKILPPFWLNYPKNGSLNLHFSLLPKYRGANPAEWAILLNEKQTGITLINMSPGLDTGDIITKQSLPITPRDTRVTLYHKLYQIGAKYLPEMLIKHHHWLQKADFTCQASLAPKPQPQKSPTPQARQFKRDDGYIPWPLIKSCLEGKPLDSSQNLHSHLLTAWNVIASPTTNSNLLTPIFIERATRALYGYPGAWTKVQTQKGSKRLKIHSATVKNQKLILDQVQLEGLKPTPFNHIKNQLI